MAIFVLILLMYIFTIFAIRSIIKDNKKELKKDKEYYE